MQKYIKNLIIFIFTLIYLTVNLISISFAEAIWPTYDENIYSKSAIALDADSGIILYEKNIFDKKYPASLVKVMTAVVTLDNVSNLNETVNFTYNAVTKDIDKNSTTIGASAGDTLTVKECLYSILLPSANDAANALAEHVAGSINDFVLLMNMKAKEIGMNNTNFVNPSGLHDDNQYTTAYDMSLLLQYAIKKRMFLQISSTFSFTHAPIRRYKSPNNSNNTILNNNNLITPGSRYYYSKVTSGKTGHTKQAGYNIMCSARDNNMNVIFVGLGCEKIEQRFLDAINVFKFIFNNYDSLLINKSDKRFDYDVDTLTVNRIKLVDIIKLTCKDNYHVTIPKTCKFDDLTSELSFKLDTNYTYKDEIGTIKYYLDGKPVGMCYIEGLYDDKEENIYVNYLDTSTTRTINTNIENTRISDSLNNRSKLIYTSRTGKIIISKALVDIIKYFVIITVSLIIIFMLYYYILRNLKFNIIKSIKRLYLRLTHRKYFK